jgi:hypothetical protein
MRGAIFRALFGRRGRAAPAVMEAESLVRRIDALVRAPTPFPLEEEAAGASDAVVHSRAALALNLLRLRAMRDPAAPPALFGYMRLAFGSEDYAHVAAALDGAIREKEQMVARAGGADLARRVHAAIDAAGLFSGVENMLDDALGVTETPTEATFDEDAYLAANPDVAAAVARGEAASGLAHWRKHGAAEGRAQRRLRARNSRALVFPLRFARDEASNSDVGDLLPATRRRLAEIATPPIDARYAIAPLSQAEEHDATPSFAEEASLGCDCAAFKELLDRRQWTAPPLYVAAFENAWADLRNGVALFDEDRVWGDSSYATFLSPGGHVRAPDIFPIGGRYAWMRSDDAVEAISSDTPLMLCTTWASRINYGHWLMNTLFSAYLVLDELKAGRIKLLCPPLDDRQRRELLTLGAPPEAIVETSARYVRVARLLYPSPLSTYANMKPPARVVDFLDFVSRRFAPPAPGTAPDHVFLSRAGFPSARRMTNEQTLCDALRHIGFHVAHTHELTLGEQIALMSNARLAVGQFGAALWNTPFMPRGARVVEIATSNYVSNEYLYISHLAGHRLHRAMIEASTAQGRADHGDHFEFEAPVEEIVALARSLM